MWSDRQNLTLFPNATLSRAAPPLSAELEEGAAGGVGGEGVPRREIETRRRIASLRYAGQESSLAVEWRAGLDLRRVFEERYAATYGHRPEARPVELESLRVVASTCVEEAAPAEMPEPFTAPTNGSSRVWLGGGWQRIPCYERE